MRGTESERFWAKVDKRGPDECWPWLGSSTNGYGQFRSTLPSDSAQRYAYGKPLPPEHKVLTTCRNSLCCNRAHLFIGTQRVRHALMKKRDRYAKGEKNGQSKLTADAVRAILTSQEKQAVLAKRYGVSVRTISMVKRHLIWKHVECPPSPPSQPSP